MERGFLEAVQPDKKPIAMMEHGRGIDPTRPENFLAGGRTEAF
jgi:hypothetical protein